VTIVFGTFAGAFPLRVSSFPPSGPPLCLSLSLFISPARGLFPDTHCRHTRVTPRCHPFRRLCPPPHGTINLPGLKSRSVRDHDRRPLPLSTMCVRTHAEMRGLPPVSRVLVYRLDDIFTKGSPPSSIQSRYSVRFSPHVCTSCQSISRRLPLLSPETY